MPKWDIDKTFEFLKDASILEDVYDCETLAKECVNSWKYQELLPVDWESLEECYNYLDWDEVGEWIQYNHDVYIDPHNDFAIVNFKYIK